jgi:peptidyl-dipeptidase A
MNSSFRLLSLLPALLLAAACATAVPPAAPPAEAVVAPAAPTVAEAEAFITLAEATMLELGIQANRAAWVQSNFITEDTQMLAAKAAEHAIAAAVRFANEATRFDGVELAPDLRRRFDLLKLALTAPAPSDPAKTAELAQIAARLEATYGEGKYCPEPNRCLDLGQLSNIIATSRDPKALLEAWTGWRTISPPMRSEYQRFVELSNEGARELGFADTGAMWRSKYDMPADAFAAETDRLWEQVRPLYESLHCYVRSRLAAHYGTAVVPPGRPIPAHLLGNMWAQEWSNVYELVAPKNLPGPGYDLTSLLQKKKVDAVEMTRQGERFFTSLGLDPLPQTFWERSLFVKPRDREVVCHASAWNVDEVDDLRIKMCIEINAEDFQTVHHELGHNFYQRAYNQLPYLFRNSANDGFHEALGDTVALSVTPEYLVRIGLLDKAPPVTNDTGLLLRQALDKVAFLPFGLLVDRWRWGVFSGETTPANYNEAWWQLRQRYQGVEAPVTRSENDFDPGAKFHIPGNTPYTRYFLAHILQFQFHRSLCEIAGYQGPLHRCTIYGNREAGDRLQAMMAMGQSRPWPDALEALTGQREMDATAIIDYFAPLKTWLDQQNTGRECGW